MGNVSTPTYSHKPNLEPLSEPSISTTELKKLKLTG